VKGVEVGKKCIAIIFIVEYGERVIDEVQITFSTNDNLPFLIP